MKEFWLKAEDYVAIFDILSNATPKTTLTNYGVSNFIHLLHAYDFYPCTYGEDYKYVTTITSSYNLYTRDEEVMIIESEYKSGFKKLPSLEFCSCFKDAWERKDSATIKKLYQYLLTKNFNLFEMIEENYLNKDDTLPVDLINYYTQSLYKELYIPGSKASKNNVLNIAEKIVKRKEKYHEKYSIKMLSYLSKNKNEFDIERIKELIILFVNSNKIITNGNIDKFNELREYWKSEKFDIDTPEIWHFTGQELPGLLKKIENNYVNYRIDMSAISRELDKPLKNIKNVYYELGKLIQEECILKNIKQTFSYTRQLGNLNIENNENNNDNFIKIVDKGFELAKEKLLLDNYLSRNDVINLWKESKSLVLMEQLSTDLSQKTSSNPRKKI